MGAVVGDRGTVRRQGPGTYTRQQAGCRPCAARRSQNSRSHDQATQHRNPLAACENGDSRLIRPRVEGLACFAFVLRVIIVSTNVHLNNKQQTRNKMSTAALEQQEKTAETAPAQQSSAGPVSAPPEVALTQIMLGSLAAQTVYVAAKLGIADLLADGPKSVEDLATSTDTHAPSLYRVLRAAASLGVFTEQENRTFALNPTAQVLLSNAPNSLRDIAIFMGEDWHWNVWGQTLYSVQSGKSAWARAHGDDVFEYFKDRPDAFGVFNRAMTSLTVLSTKAVIEGYDFSGINKLVDIAGGHGRLLTEIVEANASLQGVLFDMPQVIEGARENVAKSSVADRVELVSGDFFAS